MQDNEKMRVTVWSVAMRIFLSADAVAETLRARLREVLLMSAYVLIGLGGLGQSAWAAEARVMGRVVFLQGEAQVEEGGNKRQLKLGDVLRERERITTGPQSHLYLRTVDDGFIALRPGSQLLINAYQYDPEHPAASKIQLQLDNGVLRSVTGRGGEAAKEHYRLNTPVAAIGLRGTDYTLYTDAVTSRASVRSGAIVVAGFSADCPALGGGPCQGENALVLTASQHDAIIQVRQGQTRATLIYLPQSPGVAPDRVAPPLPQENSASAGSAKVNAADSLVTHARWEASVTQLGPEEAPLVSTLHWGRWQTLVDQSTNAPRVALKDLIGNPDAQLLAINGSYVLGRDNSPPLVVPANGRYSFALHGAEAILRPDQGAVLPAQVSDGRLAVDFASRRFETGFQLQAQGQVYPMWTAGSISSRGELIGDYILPGSTMAVNGALGNASKEAAYLFQGRVGDNATAQGVTYWRR